MPAHRLPVLLVIQSATLLGSLAAKADDVDVMARTARELDAQRHEAMGEARAETSVNGGGEINLAYLYADQINDQEYGAWRADLKLYATLNAGAGQQAYLRLRAQHDGAFGKEVFVHGNGSMDDSRDKVYLDRWWYRYDWADASGQDPHLAWDFRAQVGRQHVSWGAGLVLDGDLYALRTTLSHADLGSGRLSLEAMGGYSANEDFYDFDHSRPWYNTENDRLFYGLMLAWQSNGPAQTRVYAYALAQDDHNGDAPEPALGAPWIWQTHRYDSRYFGLGASGRVFSPRLSYGVEAVLETGDAQSTPFGQTEEAIRAYAGVANLTWNNLDAARTRLEVEALVASGDPDRNVSSTNTLGGNQSGTTDEAFNAFGYQRTGYAFNAPLSNLAALRVGASALICPAAKVRVGVDGYLFRKCERAGAGHESYAGMGADLGTEVDLHADWEVFSDFTWQVRYGTFMPGDATFDQRDVRHFFYTGFRYGF